MTDIKNYGEFKDILRDWLNRKDQATLNKLPVFINFAEKQFARLVKLPYYEAIINRVTVEGNLFVEVPNDLLSIKSLAVNGKILTRTGVESLLRLQHKTELGRGLHREEPYYFARIGDRIFTHPSLSAGDLVSLVYHRDIPEMKDDKDSPYYLGVCPDLMLYLSLRHASTWLRDNEQEAYWNQKAMEAAQEINKQLDEAEWNGSSLVVRMLDEV